MFMQIIQGRSTQHDQIRDHVQQWRDQLGPTADGWLGGTFGFTDDDTFLGIVRFESREAATANSARPEQAAWAERMTALMEGPVEYHDCDDVTLFLGGGSDDAGFVQVIRGTVTDKERLKAIMSDTQQLQEIRPEILGGTLAIEADGTFIETVAFTDEASAREGERKEMPAEIGSELGSLMHDAQFLDLHQPWFASR